MKMMISDYVTGVRLWANHDGWIGVRVVGRGGPEHVPVELVFPNGRDQDSGTLFSLPADTSACLELPATHPDLQWAESAADRAVEAGLRIVGRVSYGYDRLGNPRSLREMAIQNLEVRESAFKFASTSHADLAELLVSYEMERQRTMRKHSNEEAQPAISLAYESAIERLMHYILSN